MNHYCTYFDRGFLIQGLALWRSLAAHDPDAVLWVLALDDFTAAVLRETGGTWMKVVTLAELEEGDAALLEAKTNRTSVEYIFTLSPCWPRWILTKKPEVDRITYVDADMFFFGDTAGIFAALEAASASVLITAHRFPAGLSHYAQHGKFNVGILVFKNDVAGRGCLDDWRGRCLAWCHDRLEDGKYADQRYLDGWPERLGAALLVLPDAHVNLAPWNWAACRCEVRVEFVRNERTSSVKKTERVWVDGRPLLLFHFARFRPLVGTWWWQSGQVDYGVMPRRLRNAIYGPYWRALVQARAEIGARREGFDFPPRGARLGRNFWRGLPLRVVFGGDWLRLGATFHSGRCGLGRWSGQALAKLRTIFLRA